ncbi:MAG: HAD-IA family hydrolase [Bryobacteraceae bacterium]
MENEKPIALLLDVGGVLLTNGWDTHGRQRAAAHFGLDLAVMDQRHHLTFDTYEIGKVSLDEYVDRMVFYEPREFSRQDFIEFMYQQSQPHEEMIGLVHELKARHRLKVGLLSNEGVELTRYRVDRFDLRSLADFFIFSGYVGLRKPDKDIWRLALNVGQIPADRTVFIDDRPMLAEVAVNLGMLGIHHRNVETTRAELAALGLT